MSVQVATGGSAAPGRRPVQAVLFAVGVAAGVAALTALGVWQLERRVWKLDLIARIDQRMRAAPIAAPGPAAWPAVDAAHDEYRRVFAAGHFVPGPETFVRAVTELGGGFWVLAPFRTDAGFIILVNRGFVPAERRDEERRAATMASGATVVTGLLRLTEPKGGFLRANDPAQDRWYSRDVDAIAAAGGLIDLAPYFIDADAAADPDAYPRGGLTMVRLPNNHLLYALTWFGLALLLAGAALAHACPAGAIRSKRGGAGAAPCWRRIR